MTPSHPALTLIPVYWLIFGLHTAGPAKVDTQAEAELAAKLGIRSVPTIMAFRDGVLVYSQAGAMPPGVLEDFITQVQSLDMNEVRAKIPRPQGRRSAVTA